MKKIFLFLIIYSLIITLCSCSNNEIKEQMSYDYFDTVSYIYSYSYGTEKEFDENCDLAFEVLEKYHKLFDIYHEYEGMNNLCTINKNAGKDFIVVDKLLIEFLKYAKDIYRITKGETNIMLGPIIKEWNRCKDTNVLPDVNTLKELEAFTNIDYLEIDDENFKVRISNENASIDVGSIGKGYATEKAAQALEAKKCNSYVLNIGGNVRIIGEKEDGGSWITGIKSPFNIGEIILKIEIKDTSCVTSGDYERYFEIDNIRYHHIIDKDTLYPASYFSSLTVITKDSGLADALSTALFCMSYEDGKKIIENMSDVEVIWIDRNANIFYTDGVKIKE